MKGIMVLLIVIALTLVAINSYAGPLDGVKAMCANKWNSNYQMQEFCVNNQKESFLSFYAKWRLYVVPLEKKAELESRKLMEKDLTPEAKILYTCAEKWKVDQFKTYNFQMVDFCADNQLKAYRRMN